MSWVPSLSMVGPTGPNGPPGPTGPSGPQNIKSGVATIPGISGQGTATIQLTTAFENTDYIVLLTPVDSAPTSHAYVTVSSSSQFVIHGQAAKKYFWFATPYSNS